MHELSIATAVVDQVESAVRDRAEHATVRSLTLRVGELSGVVPEALDFSFGVAAEGTVLADARLLIETVEGRARCEGCGRDTATGMPPDLWCGTCERAMTLTGGRELEIARVVLDDGTGQPPDRDADAPVRDEEASHVPHR
ncbi:hydrogenase nickel incorporation protein [Streptomyces sp. ADI96-02]|uniref:hydrogenase maturation nickel metallochaperone HypA/HybF n=1 Tax=unclassified Streptomyces TaxID=2593676 RepID=UPI000F557A56|nr:hydrogenase maturation nickel metallochaperone HypA [Streptomyces sp. ADI96-02]RPK54500.1 hydrogenase nickel incorporation protein [Streptomyces sp. ADI96-02]